MKVGIYALCSLAKAEVKYDSSYFDSLLEDIYATQMQNRNSAADYAEKLEREIKSVRDSIARGKEIIAQDLREKGSSSFSGLMCWSCSAENMDQCIEKGEVEICDNTEDSCGLEERRWTGILVGLRLGCKSKAQCHQDISDNFVLESANQCRPTDKGHSICRQCCGSDVCNRGWNIRSDSGWQYDYLS